MAATIKIITMAALRYFLRKAGVTNPNLVKKYTKIGNSNTKPLTINEVWYLNYRFLKYQTAYNQRGFDHADVGVNRKLIDNSRAHIKSGKEIDG